MHTKKFDYIYKEKVMLTDRNFEKYLIYIFLNSPIQVFTVYQVLSYSRI